MIKRILFITLLITVVLPLSAAEKQDSTYLFRFVGGRDMFYSPWKYNEGELERLTECIEQNRDDIDAGKMYLHVTSYGTAGNTKQTAAKVAKIRRNRVKSELIVRTGIKEENFVTDRGTFEPYEDDGESLRNIVVVISAYRVPPVAETPVETTPEEAVAEVVDVETPEPVCEEPIIQQQPEPQPVQVLATVNEDVTIPEITPPLPYYLRANLLRWATFAMDGGAEWRPNPNFGVLLNGTFTLWCWRRREKKYALWEVSPEVRLYLGKEKRAYLGLMGKVGSFNYKFSEPGKQGNIIGGGITGGYQLPLNEELSLDFSLGVGYLYVDYDTYNVDNGRYHKEQLYKKDYIGPISLGVTLVWHVSRPKGGNK